MVYGVNMTTHDALLAAVLAAPNDDLPRLVFADHLEGELGQPERAEFIRVQVELAKLHQKPCSVASGAWIGPLRSGRGHVAEWPNSPPGRCAMPLNELGGGLCRKCEAIPRLQRREQELIHADAPRPNGLKWSAWESWLGFNRVRCPDGMNWFRRGFVSEVRCTLAEWYSGVQCSCGFGLQQTYDCRRCGGVGRFAAIGPPVVRSHPVTRVVLTDREPSQYTGVGIRGDSWYWCTAYGDTMHLADRIPPAIAAFLVGCFRERDGVYQYHTREAAGNALSAALILWAKSQVASEVAVV